MTGLMSDVDAKNDLDVRFGGAATNAPATYYAAHMTTAPTDSTGAGGVEVVGGGYARVAVTNNPTNFGPATSSAGVRTKTNATAIQWPTATAAWGNSKGIAFFDAATGGAFREWFPYPTGGKDIVVGDVPTAGIGTLTITA